MGETHDRLAGKTAIVTGGTKGIGQGVVLRFLKEGANVVYCSRNLENDFENAARRFGRIDILVNNAQGIAPLRSILEKPDADYTMTLATGFYHSLWTIKAAVPHMRKAGGGRIINFSSHWNIWGQPFSSDYNITKSANEALTRNAAREFGPDNITVNCITPAGASYAYEVYKQMNPTATEETERTIPMRRMGDCERDIAGAILGLVSDNGRFVTGQVFCVDCGTWAAAPVQQHESGTDNPRRTPAEHSRSRMRSEAMGLLSGQVAIVIGASNEIAQGIALRFGREGAILIAVDPDPAQADALAARIEAAGGKARAYGADIGQVGEAERLAADIVSFQGGIDILVNASHPPLCWARLDQDPSDRFRSAFEATVAPAVAAMTAVRPHMVRRGGGRINNVGSVYGASANEGVADVVTMDGALAALSRAAGVEWARDNVLVNFLQGAAPNDAGGLPRRGGACCVGQDRRRRPRRGRLLHAAIVACRPAPAASLRSPANPQSPARACGSFGMGGTFGPHDRVGDADHRGGADRRAPDPGGDSRHRRLLCRSRVGSAAARLRRRQHAWRARLHHRSILLVENEPPRRPLWRRPAATHLLRHRVDPSGARTRRPRLPDLLSLVGVGRMLISNPDWPHLIRTGCLDAIRPYSNAELMQLA